MGWFSSDKIENQYKKISENIIKKFNEEFTAGYKFGYQEYNGSWEGKSWKDDLTKFVKSMDYKDNLAILGDAKNLGLGIGKLNAMLKTGRIINILEDDEASGIVVEIIIKLDKIDNFNTDLILKNFHKIKTKKLSPDAQQNHKKIILALK